MNALALVALAAAPASDVLDVGPGHPYATIGQAVAAAANGDLIRVLGGDHGSFAVQGKGVHIQVEPGVTMTGTVRVQGLLAGQELTIHGLSVLGDATDLDDTPLILGHNQGSVRISDSAFLGDKTSYVGGPFSGPEAQRAARIVDCADVAFVDSTLRSGVAYWFIPPVDSGVKGGTAASIVRSTVTFHGCTVQGADSMGENTPGDLGVRASESDLYLQGTELRGGYGDPGGFTWLPASDGEGLWLQGGHVDFLDSPHTFTGGSVWRTRLGTGTTAASHPGGGLELIVAARIRDDAGPLLVTATGDATDTVILVDGPVAARRPLPGFVGDLLVGGGPGTLRRRFLGIGASLDHLLPVPDVPPLSAMQIHLQTVHLRPDASAPSGRLVLFGPARVVQVLDASL